MTQEEKSLLLQDLCTRLPYDVKGRVYAETTNGTYDINGDMIFFDSPFDVILDEINISTEELHVIAIGNEDTIDFIEDQQVCGSPFTIYDFKPYLRSMSSMTEKERDEFEDESNCWFFVNEDGEIYPMGRLTNSEQFECGILSGFRYLLENHFDYHDLISKGLALEAPEGMYKIK